MIMYLPQRRSTEQEDSVGLVYTRNESGSLRAPKGYELKLCDGKYRTNIEPKAATCSTQDSYGLYSPCTLYSIALDFVAKNIDLVDSLLGFPEIVGKDLFDKVNLNKGFIESPSATFPVFFEAYGSIVLGKLNLNGEHLAVSEVDFLINVTNYLTEIDLSDCYMGSGHELVSHVSKLSSLRKLSLKSNSLKDDDMRFFTLSLRVTGSGLSNLEYLDLSYNPGISKNSLRYLLCFPSLLGLNLTETSLSPNDDFHHFSQKTGLVLDPKSTDFDEPFTQTEGWSSSIINDWLNKLKVKKPKNIKDKRKHCGFYAPRKRTPKKEIKSLSKNKFKIDKDLCSLIIFSKEKQSKQNSQTVKVNREKERDVLTARKQILLKNGKNKKLLQCHKRKQHSDDESLIEERILGLYTENNSATKLNKKCKLSLFDLMD